MKGNAWWNSLGVLVLLMGCSTAKPSAQSSQPSPNTQSAQPGATQPKFGSPMVTSSLAGMATVPVPGLIQPTNPQARVPAITAGRSDPFALLSMPSLTIGSVTPTTQSPSVSVPAAPTVTSTLPGSLPALPPRPLPTVALKPLPPLANPNSMPLIPISPLPSTPLSPATTVSAAEAIVVTGAMQLGNRWNLIIKEPDAASSRYVQVGDYLANGRVLVKRVVTGPGGGLGVVLQQDGREINKSISGLTPSMARK